MQDGWTMEDTDGQTQQLLGQMAVINGQIQQ